MHYAGMRVKLLNSFESIINANSFRLKVHRNNDVDCQNMLNAKEIN